MTTSDLDPAQTSFQFASTRTVLQALQALSTNVKQVIQVTLTSAAVTLRCEDEGKVCQSSVRFPRAFFAAFHFSGAPSTFCVHLAALADALRVFAALPDIIVCITETADHLVLEAVEDDKGIAVAMYAHLTVVTSHIVGNLLDHWQPPATEFAAAPGLLREAVDDLEWPQGHVRVTVTAHPLQVSMAGHGSAGELEVVLPPQQLRNHVTHEASVCHHYPFKFLKAALTGAASTRTQVGTQVAIDANGMLQVKHTLPTAPNADAVDASQDVAADVVLTYAVQPLFDEDVEELAR